MYCSIGPSPAMKSELTPTSTSGSKWTLLASHQKAEATQCVMSMTIWASWTMGRGLGGGAIEQHQIVIAPSKERRWKAERSFQPNTKSRALYVPSYHHIS